MMRANKFDEYFHRCNIYVKLYIKFSYKFNKARNLQYFTSLSETWYKFGIMTNQGINYLLLKDIVLQMYFIFSFIDLKVLQHNMDF